MAPLISFTLGAILGMLALLDGSAAGSVFVTDRLVSTFAELGSRQCLPDDFDTPEGDASLARNVAAYVSDPNNIPDECKAVPVLALFYNAYASGAGLLSADAFDIDGLTTASKSYSEDEYYQWKIDESMFICGEFGLSPPQGLSPRQLAVYSYSCLKWTLFTDCDFEQEMNGALDESGLLRRARFLTGSCPTSPDTLQEALHQATGRSVAKCRRGLYSGDDAQQLYDAGVSLIACLLKDFTDADDVVDLPVLRVQIQSDVEYADRLDAVLVDCIETLGKATAAEFAGCWAASGVFSCAVQEATELASAFPTDCAMSL